MDDLHHPRGPERRQQDGRREVDRRTHLLEQAVLSAALQFVELDADAGADERIRRHRELRDRVRAYMEFSELGAANLIDLVATLVLIVAIVVPTSLIGTGAWPRWLAVALGLAAAALLLWRGERNA